MLSMNTDDIRNLLGPIIHAFSRTVQEYATLRAYVSHRYGEPDPDLTAWLMTVGGAYVDPESVPKAAEWDQMFYEAWHGLHVLLNDYDAESDEITQVVYEEALTDGEPWAEEAHERRQS
jgi:hypothetical protein